jgi:hypothetical protein
MRGACEQEAARLREALEHFKREMEIETARVKREAEIETAVLRRLIEIFKGAEPSDAIPPYLMIGGYGPVQAFALPNPFAVLLLRQLTF